MSLDKAIEHGKEKRKRYCGAKAIDATCRNHGSDKWCEENRRHKFRDPCADCRWLPPSSLDGKPCCAYDSDDPLMNCYERREAKE